MVYSLLVFGGYRLGGGEMVEIEVGVVGRFEVVLG